MRDWNDVMKWYLCNDVIFHTWNSVRAEFRSCMEIKGTFILFCFIYFFKRRYFISLHSESKKKTEHFTFLIRVLKYTYSVICVIIFITIYVMRLWQTFIPFFSGWRTGIMPVCIYFIKNQKEKRKEKKEKDCYVPVGRIS